MLHCSYLEFLGILICLLETLVKPDFCSFAACVCDFSNGKNCVDIDECSEDLNGCQTSCENLIGSYRCSCDDGFELAANGRDCEGMMMMITTAMIIYSSIVHIHFSSVHSICCWPNV